MSNELSQQFTQVDKSLGRFWRAIEHVASPYFAWKSLRNKMGTDREFFESVREESQIWMPVLHSLQMNQFISLGRIFDTDSRTFSVKRLEKICKQNIDEFSKQALLSRKGWGASTKESTGTKNLEEYGFDIRMGLDASEETEYIDRAYEITKKDLTEIFRSLGNAESNYKKGAKKARDNIFAHSHFELGESADGVIKDVVVGEFERILDDLHTVYSLLWSCLHNGHAPNRIPIKYRRNANLEREVDRLAIKVKNRY